MRFKLDENIPRSPAADLRSLGHDADTTGDELLNGKDDETVWHAAQSEKRMLITCDLDFADIRRFRPGTHAGILLLRLGDEAEINLIRKTVADVVSSLTHTDLSGSFIVAGLSKLRIVRPSDTPSL
ncbi:MAG TPA: DUF5615 family PIN-like protein [Phycisphaerales bacterium]|nr:DUF5615 family PIN-like protein [Phycisphaerales bacterium]